MHADSRARSPDVDLVVATVGRERELSELLESVRDQADVAARVIVVDQNVDDRVERLLAAQPSGMEVVHLRAARGPSRARSIGLTNTSAPLVAWPDDDCRYPPGLLSYVAGEFAADPSLDVLVGRIADPSGALGLIRRSNERLRLDLGSLWRYASAPGFFARREAALCVGEWSTAFGPGSEEGWDAGEDTDWLIRAVRAGLDVRFDPAVRVLHIDPFVRGAPEGRARARRYGRSTSAVALQNGYGGWFVVLLVVRAAAGAIVSLLRGRFSLARIHFQAMAGRIEGAVRFERRRRGARSDVGGAPGDTSRQVRPRR